MLEPRKDQNINESIPQWFKNTMDNKMAVVLIIGESSKLAVLKSSHLQLQEIEILRSSSTQKQNGSM